jgi:hypothetical protein
MSYADDGFDRQRDRELEDRAVESREETIDLDAWDRIRLQRDTQEEM